MAAQLQRLAHRFVLVALLIALGLSPVLMQTVAWARMLVDYSRSSTFPTAVAMTFDGDHPCELCQKVQNAQKEGQTDRKPQALHSTREIVFFHEAGVMRMAPLVTMTQAQGREHDLATLITRDQKPPLPPPRRCA